ncbi:transposase [Solwaraspora sp. WMMA2065]|uniref:RNA-guided endonuclease InsQ/TnpB family protein n=1 Tax=Solwaraspora sp. WMMA2065 TaxID=3015166 RepID=UPI00259BC902|nr:transposase [Solwaraspora sp. WMMA2065]WJK37681.1 transposase [Solwaraspora sp. WMMA2065]
MRRERVTYNATSAMLTGWKKTDELAFLNDVSCVPLQQALRHLQTAFANFFAKRARYPTFKSRKRSRRSAEYTASAFRWRDGRLTLAKMTEPLDIVWSRPLPQGAAPSTVTVSQDPAGRWFVSLLCDDRIDPAPATTAAVVGVDAGLDSLFTLSTGEKIPNPRHERRDRRRLARAQRNLARKAKGSANRAKARLAVARIHARIADRRRDHLHKLTTRLVRETQTIVIEDLTVRNMMANHSLARAVSDAAWRQFRSMLGYRTDWYGRDLVVVDRWFPSTRLCSACGVLAEHLPLAVRSWTCRCGQAHDRDVNAARNILAEGLSVIACGGGVRPHRESSSRTGRSSVKQEPPGATQGIPVPSGRGGSQPRPVGPGQGPPGAGGAAAVRADAGRLPAREGRRRCLPAAAGR